MAKVYLAAPLFTLAEQTFNLDLARYLQDQGLTVFCPQVACEGKAGRDIYQTCLEGLSNADVVVAILDGADADSGTCWECGYAVAKGIPVIAVRTDFRRSGDTGGFNAMLYYSAAAVIETSVDLFPTIATTVNRLVGHQ
ncbi:MAG: nucleoside 2-deoxyribosyltransferase [Gloeomargarita sp. SKYBB_i_bin120]|nr:nucleoside 2-deoxyribosyltransferase [Gloeomargarita sp. SKYB120]MDW8177686.1 nucleoside 2-deoxyribosyltransferase [Gloeomargarita sp. SKYBB_i_bin120]